MCSSIPTRQEILVRLDKHSEIIEEKLANIIKTFTGFNDTFVEEQTTKINDLNKIMLDFQTNSHTEHESTQKEVKKLSRNLDLKADMAIMN